MELQTWKAKSFYVSGTWFFTSVQGECLQCLPGCLSVWVSCIHTAQGQLERHLSDEGSLVTNQIMSLFCINLWSFSTAFQISSENLCLGSYTRWGLWLHLPLFASITAAFFVSLTSVNLFPLEGLSICYYFLHFKCSSPELHKAHSLTSFSHSILFKCFFF